MSKSLRALFLGLAAAAIAAPPASGTQNAASLPDFSGIWVHPTLPGFELPLSGPGPVRNYKGKGLQLQFTVDDDGVFTTPWSATITCRRAANEWRENVCAENMHEYYYNKEADVPTADRADF